MEGESRMCSQSPEPLSAVTLSASSKANREQDAANIIASRDAVNGRKGGPGNSPALKFLTLPCWVCPENCKTGEKEQNVLSLLWPLFLFTAFTWKMGQKIWVLYIHAFTSLGPSCLGLSFSRSGPWGKAVSSSGLFGRWLQETRSREWGNEIEKGGVGEISLLLVLWMHLWVGRAEDWHCRWGCSCLCLWNRPPSPVGTAMPFLTTKDNIYFSSPQAKAGQRFAFTSRWRQKWGWAMCGPVRNPGASTVTLSADVNLSPVKRT